MRWTGSTAVIAVLALCACTPSDDSESSARVDAARQPVAPNKAEVEAGTVQLGGNDITVTGPISTSLAFGSPRDAVEAELTKVLGPAAGKNSNDECGAGPMETTVFKPGLTVNFQDGKLVGWYLDGETSLRTDKGIGRGSPAADFVAAHAGRAIEDSTLGAEFYSERDGIGAFMGGEAKEAVVESLYAGTNCFFR